MNDSFTVSAPPERVWAFLTDIPRVSSCIPGVEGVSEIGPDVYRGRLRVKVGPLSASFEGRVTLGERVPLQRLVAHLEGEDRSLASLVKATFTGTIHPVDTGTRVDYQMEVALRGRLAQFGTPVIQATARKMTAEFVKRLQEALAQ